MKESGIPWIPVIPSGWEVEKGKNILSLQKRPVRDTDEVVTCFRDGEVVLRSERRTDGFTMSDKEIGYQGINKGDIVIHGMDGFAGSMGVSKSTGKGSPVLVVCTPKYDAVPQYLIYYLRVLAQMNVFVALATGIRERSCDLRWNKIADLQFIMPSTEEQQKIADFIDSKCGEIDEAIALQEEFIEELKAYKQSVITEAVTRGLNPNVKLKDSGIDWIGKIPQGWRTKKLKFSCQLYGRIGFRGYTADDLVPEGEGAITLSPTNMDGIMLDFSKCTYLKWDKYYESPEIMVKNGDVLLVKTASVGKCSYVEGLPMETTVNPQIMVLKYHKDNAKYIAYMFQTPLGTYYIDTTKGGSTIYTISQEKIGNYEFPFPTLSEQQQIVDYLDNKCAEIDSLIAIKQQKIEELKDYKKSIIYEYVTGKKEVK